MKDRLDIDLAEATIAKLIHEGARHVAEALKLIEEKEKLQEEKEKLKAEKTYWVYWPLIQAAFAGAALLSVSIGIVSLAFTLLSNKS